jgi:hypothetical protein
MSDLKNKTEFKNTFYLFHNYVNAKKRKRLFNSANMPIYGKYRLADVVNNFISKYHTKGNMKLLTESFQRQLVVKEFKGWFTRYIKAFVPRVNIPQQILVSETSQNVKSEEPVTSETSFEEPVTSETSVEEVVVIEEEHVASEATVDEEQEQDIVEEEIVDKEPEPNASEEEDHIATVEEEIVAIVEEEPVHNKKKKGRKSKK